MNINLIQNLVEEGGIIFLTYGGFLTQSLITAMMEALEKEIIDNDIKIGISSNIFTIFIELTQNMMNYSKCRCIDKLDIKSSGLVLVSKKEDDSYSIHSQNIVTSDDKEKIEARLNTINSLSYEDIKRRYKELRRSGKDTHGKGGGIGFYEIAKRSDEIKYEFKKINENKYYFHFISKINIHKR